MAAQASYTRFGRMTRALKAWWLDPAGAVLPSWGGASGGAGGDRKTNGVAFGGPTKYYYPRCMRARWIQVVLSAYIVFAFVLTTIHFFRWASGPRRHWRLERTYDSDKDYSLITDMTTAHKFNKLFDKSLPETLENVQPYWLPAEMKPLADDVSLVTYVTEDRIDAFVELAEKWQGPISATIHLISPSNPFPSETQSLLFRLRNLHTSNLTLKRHADIHLIITPPSPRPVSLAHNLDRNLARLFARTEFILFTTPDTVPATNVRQTIRTHADVFHSRLRLGDVFVLPTFAYASDFSAESQVPHRQIPTSKNSVVGLVANGEMGLLDNHWKLNTGPTCYDHWKDAESVYPVEEYEFHYEPVVIMSRDASFWCPERFMENKAACLYGTYLSGGEFWVLPDDFMVKVFELKEPELSKFESTIANRMYNKFHWEMCVHYARQLDSLGVWDTPRAKHAKVLCARVLQNWGRGLVGGTD